jgi:hypothetical protein
MNPEIAREAESFIKEVLSIVTTDLDKDLIFFVDHYLYHGEYEMAFEGLLLAIMKLDTIPPIDWRRSTEMAKKLNLNKESIYDEDFWSRFSTYIEGKMA